MTQQLEMHREVAGIKFYRTGHLADDGFMERKWRVQGLLLENGCGMISGDAKIGKTWLSLDLGASVASGKPFLGKFPVGKGRVLLWLREDPPNEIEMQMRSVCAYHNLDQRNLDIIMGDPTEEVNLEKEEDQQRFLAVIDELKPALVVLDTFASFFGGDENSAQDVKRATRFILRVARATGTAILVTHHMKKNKTGGKSAGDKMRGNGELHAWGDHYWMLERDKRGIITFATDQRLKNVEPFRIRIDEKRHNVSCMMADDSPVIEMPKLNPKEDFEKRLLQFFREGFPKAATVREARAVIGGDTTRYKPALAALVFAGELVKLKKGFKAKDRGLVCPAPLGSKANQTEATPARPSAPAPIGTSSDGRPALTPVKEVANG